MISGLEILETSAVGFAAGALGGLLGLGGSIIMIPVLVGLLNKNYHTVQAAAMCVNFGVACIASRRHLRAKAIPWAVIPWVLPFALLAIITGVTLSNHLEVQQLKWIFGAFLALLSMWMGWNLFHTRGKDAHPDDITLHPKRGAGVGMLVGLQAGLLGVGGGIVAVPLLKRIVHLPLRQAVAASSFVMCLTAPAGSLQKILTLPEGASTSAALWLALLLTPSALLGSWIGASCTHKFPTWLLQSLLLTTMVLGACRMLL